jgi:hypothetical protein
MIYPRQVIRIDAKRSAYMMLVAKPEGKRPLGRPERRRANSIKMDGGGVDWIDLAQVRDQWEALVNTVMSRFHKMMGSS